MALEADNWQLFGLDLRKLARAWRRGWEEVRGWPAFAWLSPQEPVRVLLPYGGETLRLGASATPAAPGEAARAVAVVLPDSAVLVRRLVLPPLTAWELREAVGLEVAAVSPFPLRETVWGVETRRRHDRLVLRLALTARTHVAAWLERSRERLAGTEPEVWADAAAPIVIAGYAEGLRAARQLRARRRLLAGLGSAALLVLALAATPVLQARQRLLEAQARYAALASETAGLVAALDALARANAQARAVQAQLSERPEALRLIEALAVLLPNDAYLDRLEVHGRQVRISGQADNAAALMEALGARGTPFREVHAPFPISRAPASDKESFTLELVLAGEEATQ